MRVDRQRQPAMLNAAHPDHRPSPGSCEYPPVAPQLPIGKDRRQPVHVRDVVDFWLGLVAACSGSRLLQLEIITLDVSRCFGLVHLFERFRGFCLLRQQGRRLANVQLASHRICD